MSLASWNRKHAWIGDNLSAELSKNRAQLRKSQIIALENQSNKSNRIASMSGLQLSFGTYNRASNRTYRSEERQIELLTMERVVRLFELGRAAATG